MPHDLRIELDSFNRFIVDRLAVDQPSLSLEEALDLWREQNPSLEEFEENVAAIQEALDDLRGGEQGIPLEEFDRNFRQRHSLPPDE